MAAHWYVVHVYSGSEKKVAESLREQAVLKNMEDKILEVMVPTENIVEIKKGSRVNSERKFFPGYVLVKMEIVSSGRLKKASSGRKRWSISRSASRFASATDRSLRLSAWLKTLTPKSRG